MVDDAVVVVLGRQPGQAEPGRVGGGGEQPKQPHPVRVVRLGQRGRRGRGPVRRHLLSHRDDLRDSHHDRGARGQAHGPDPGPELQPGPEDHPWQQGQDGHDRHQDGRFLVGQQRSPHDHAENDRPAPAGPPAQQHRGLERQRDEQLARREIDQVPALVGDHGGQAEEGAGGERRRLRAHPQPRAPVHRVARQPRHQHRQHVVGGGRAEGQRDGRQQQVRQRHQRVEAELRADRRGQVVSQPRVGQVRELPGEPPEAPHVRAGVTRPRQLVVEQVGDSRPGEQDARADVGQKDHQVPPGGAQHPAGHPPGPRVPATVASSVLAARPGVPRSGRRRDQAPRPWPWAGCRGQPNRPPRPGDRPGPPGGPLDPSSYLVRPVAAGLRAGPDPEATVGG